MQLDLNLPTMAVGNLDHLHQEQRRLKWQLTHIRSQIDDLLYKSREALSFNDLRVNNEEALRFRASCTKKVTKFHIFYDITLTRLKVVQSAIKQMEETVNSSIEHEPSLLE